MASMFGRGFNSLQLHYVTLGGFNTVQLHKQKNSVTGISNDAVLFVE